MSLHHTPATSQKPSTLPTANPRLFRRPLPPDSALPSHQVLQSLDSFRHKAALQPLLATLPPGPSRIHSQLRPRPLFRASGPHPSICTQPVRMDPGMLLFTAGVHSSPFGCVRVCAVLPFCKCLSPPPPPVSPPSSASSSEDLLPPTQPERRSPPQTTGDGTNGRRGLKSPSRSQTSRRALATGPS